MSESSSERRAGDLHLAWVLQERDRDLAGLQHDEPGVNKAFVREYHREGISEDELICGAMDVCRISDGVSDGGGSEGWFKQPDEGLLL